MGCRIWGVGSGFWVVVLDGPSLVCPHSRELFQIQAPPKSAAQITSINTMNLGSSLEAVILFHTSVSIGIPISFNWNVCGAQ